MRIVARHYEEKKNVYNKVSAAIKKGLLKKLDGSVPCCDCGLPATEYDHRDYREPLKVDPTCRNCNRKRGRSLDTIKWLERYGWSDMKNVVAVSLKCARCGHVWTPRKTGEIRMCAKCKSAYWDVQKLKTKKG